MTNVIKRFQHFLNYWYVRYLLVTELYMVEPWEKVVIHVLFTILFGLFWYFNYSIIMTGVGHLRSSPLSVQQIL